MERVKYIPEGFDVEGMGGNCNAFSLYSADGTLGGFILARLRGDDGMYHIDVSIPRAPDAPAYAHVATIDEDGDNTVAEHYGTAEECAAWVRNWIGG